MIWRSAREITVIANYSTFQMGQTSTKHAWSDQEKQATCWRSIYAVAPIHVFLSSLERPTRTNMDTLTVEDVLGDSIGLFGDEERDDGTIHYGPLTLTTAPKV